MVKQSGDAAALDGVFAALADPTRRAIVGALARGEASVGVLAEPFAMSLPAISKHLRVLEQAGLVAREKEGRMRRCRLLPAPLRQAGDWIIRTRHFWEDRLDALEDYLAGGARRANRSGRTKHVDRLRRQRIPVRA